MIFGQYVGAQQGQGSNPGLCVTLVERLLWARCDADATEHQRGVEVDGQRASRTSWADDNLTASSHAMLRCMLRRMDQLLEGCGMAADWGDPGNCTRVSANDGDPDHIEVGRGTIRRTHEIRILGRIFNLQHIEDRMFPDRVTKARKALWVHRNTVTRRGFPGSMKARFLTTAVRPTILGGLTCIDITKWVTDAIRRVLRTLSSAFRHILATFGRPRNETKRKHRDTHIMVTWPAIPRMLPPTTTEAWATCTC